MIKSEEATAGLSSFQRGVIVHFLFTFKCNNIVCKVLPVVQVSKIDINSITASRKPQAVSHVNVTAKNRHCTHTHYITIRDGCAEIIFDARFNTEYIPPHTVLLGSYIIKAHMQACIRTFLGYLVSECRYLHVEPTYFQLPFGVGGSLA